MKTITRKSMLYQTGVEYGDYTMNHVQGCAHGCKYPCYAFLMKKRFGQIKDYDTWLEPYLVSNTLELLDKEIPRLRGKIQSVQLCFTTDPFMQGYPEVSCPSSWQSFLRRMSTASHLSLWMRNIGRKWNRVPLLIQKGWLLYGHSMM